MYGIYYTFFDSIPRVYPERYRFTVRQLGLVFLCIFAACVVSGAVYSLYVHHTSKARGQDYSVNHEICLRPALLASTLPLIGLFLFGWTADWKGVLVACVVVWKEAQNSVESVITRGMR